MSCTCAECKHEGTTVCGVCSNYMGVPDRWEAKPKTRGDKIRNLDDESLAEKFEEIQLNTVKAYGNDDLLLKGELKKYWLAWLQAEDEI